MRWWSHRRRRSRVQVERTVEAWPEEIADAAGLAGSRILSAMVDAWGWTARVALKRGQSVEHAVKQVPALESALGVRPRSVRVEEDPTHAGRVYVRVLTLDPHANALPWPGLSEPVSITDPVELGVYEDGRPVVARLFTAEGAMSVLLGGVNGSGKSNVLNLIVAHLVAATDAVGWGIDRKGGTELGPWEDAGCLTRVATTQPASEQLLADAVAEIDSRGRRMRALGWKTWRPSRADPVLVIVIDEYAEVARTKRAAGLAESIAQRGRAAGVLILVSTQRPTQESLGGGNLRSQARVRISMRMREKRDTDLVLGTGATNEGWRADRLRHPGAFLIDDETPEARPTPARSYLITDTDVDHVASAHGGRQPDLHGDGAGIPRQRHPHHDH